MPKHLVALILVGLGCLLGVTLWQVRQLKAESMTTVVYAAVPAVPRVEPLSPVVATARNRSAVSGAAAIQKKVTSSGNFILWHPEAIRQDDTYDVVIHFHGIPQALEPALAESGLRAFLLVIDAGLVTGDYRNAYGMAGSLERLLKAMRAQVSQIAGRSMHEARVAVSAWSAGSGAIMPMLRRPAEARLLDGVVLSDGLHASFLEPKKREIATAQLEPVRDYAAQAMQGLKYFALSHTAIQTDGYASTTETAERLLSLLGLSETHVFDPPESREPFTTSRAEAGALRVLGFAGQDKRAHGRQQWAIGRILWSGLADRWNRR